LALLPLPGFHRILQIFVSVFDRNFGRSVLQVTYNQDNPEATSKRVNCVSQQVLLNTSTGCAAGENEWMPYCNGFSSSALKAIFEYDANNRFQFITFSLNTSAIPAFTSTVTSATVRLSCYSMDQADKYSAAVFHDVSFG
jgi:hypothetical protein